MNFEDNSTDVVLITNYEGLTIYNVYTVLNCYRDCYYIIGDNYEERIIPRQNFISLEEYRSRQIDKLL